MRHLVASWCVPSNFLSRITRPWARQRARNYLAREQVPVVAGTTGEIAANPVDLANLHRLIRRRRPSVVLEFGTGFSTVVIADALSRNGAGRLWTVDASAAWIDNTRGKLPEHLRDLVDFRHTTARAVEHDGQLCALYDSLPDIVPDFIYVDGPSTRDVQGSVRGLSFAPESAEFRRIVSADPLLLESTLQVGAFMLLDSRYNTAHFLAWALRRRWRRRWNRIHGWVTFELLEWTGRSRSSRPAAEKRR
jgi:hypothetical protein